MTIQAAPKPKRRKVRRPRQARSRHTVETILEGGARVLAERGWARFTTNAVADRAGVSIGSLYEYFPNKEALRDAIVSLHLDDGERIFAEVLTETTGRAAASGPLDAETAVSVLIDGFVRLHTDDPALHRELSALVPLLPAHRDRIEALRTRVVDALATALRPEANRPARTALVIVELVDALTHRWIVEGAPLSEEDMRREIRAVALGYLCRQL